MLFKTNVHCEILKIREGIHIHTPTHKSIKINHYFVPKLQPLWTFWSASWTVWNCWKVTVLGPA